MNNSEASLFYLILIRDSVVRSKFYEGLSTYKNCSRIDFLKDGYILDSTLLAKDLYRKYSEFGSYSDYMKVVKVGITLHALELERESFLDNITLWEGELKYLKSFLAKHVEAISINDVLIHYRNYQNIDKHLEETVSNYHHLLRSLRKFDRRSELVIEDTRNLYHIFINKIYEKIEIKLYYFYTPLCARVYLYRIPSYYSALDFEYGNFYTVSRTEEEARLKATLHVLELSLTPFLESLTVDSYKTSNFLNC